MVYTVCHCDEWDEMVMVVNTESFPLPPQNNSTQNGISPTHTTTLTHHQHHTTRRTTTYAKMSRKPKLTETETKQLERQEALDKLEQATARWEEAEEKRTRWSGLGVFC
jgi:hypothetical protein